MDALFIILAALCWGRSPSMFLGLLLTEFIVATAWTWFPELIVGASWNWFPEFILVDPWWFLTYAIQNCAFIVLIMRTRHRYAREYAVTLIASALLALAVFCEYYVGGDSLYAIRPSAMAAICVYQLWIAAVGAGLIEGTPLEIAHGIGARCFGRRGHPGADHSSRNMDRGL